MALSEKPIVCGECGVRFATVRESMDHEHMQSDAEYATVIDGFSVTVDKDGGGTLGREYDGTWTVTVKNGDVFVLDNDEIRTGTPKTHAQVAQIAYEFASERI